MGLGTEASLGSVLVDQRPQARDLGLRKQPRPGLTHVGASGGHHLLLCGKIQICLEGFSRGARQRYTPVDICAHVIDQGRLCDDAPAWVDADGPRRRHVDGEPFAIRNRDGDPPGVLPQQDALHVQRHAACKAEQGRLRAQADEDSPLHLLHPHEGEARKPLRNQSVDQSVELPRQELHEGSHVDRLHVGWDRGEDRVSDAADRY